MEERMKKIVKKKVVKDDLFFKILKETPAKYVKMDLDINSTLKKYLLDYAEAMIPVKKKEELLIEWALNEILENSIEDDKRKSLETNK